MQHLPIVSETQSQSLPQLRTEILSLGADDVGFVSLEDPRMAHERDEILAALPRARTLVSFCVRMNPDAIRSPGRDIANLEFHHVNHDADSIAAAIATRLRARGARAVAAAAGFPMDMDKFPGKLWTVSHKLVAEAAGLGKMGIHRNLIHPRFGNFVFLGTVITDLTIEEASRPLDFNPCFECKLCVAACPTGAISKDGHFNFSACYTHNYREFMGGFTDFVETIADSKNSGDLRRRIPDTESTSWWQSLSYGANYKAAYCMAVCPAGEEIGAHYHARKKEFVDEVVRPLQKKTETVYVNHNSDAEEVVRKRFPHKPIKYVSNTLRPQNIDGLLAGMPLTFQPGKARGLELVVSFAFLEGKQMTGQATVSIRDQRMSIEEGLDPSAQTRVAAQADAWLGFVRKERSLFWAMLRGHIRVRGSLTALSRFASCFAQ